MLVEKRLDELMKQVIKKATGEPDHYKIFDTEDDYCGFRRKRQTDFEKLNRLRERFGASPLEVPKCLIIIRAERGENEQTANG